MAESFGRLQEEHVKEIQDTRGKIQQWQNFLQDYDALHGRLQTLPDSITHDVMVPFGSKAFFHGQLIHTNEVLVLLGDNWFVDRSARQAQEIIDRRRNHLQRLISDNEKVVEDLHQRMRATAGFATGNDESDIQEIREELDEQDDEPAMDDRSSSASSTGRDQPDSSLDSDAGPRRTHRVAHTPKTVNGRVAHPPRRVFPSQSVSSASPSSSTSSSSSATRNGKTPAATASPGQKPSFEELLSRLEEAEKSNAIPASKQIPMATDSTQRVKFQHSAPPSAKDQNGGEIAGIGSPADIYAQFMDEQKHRHQSGQPSTLDQVQDDDSVVLDGSAGLAALSRMKLRDADDDDDDDDPSDANGNVIDGDEENAARSIDLSRTPERSSLKKKKNKAPRDARVRFNEEPQVKEFCKSDSAGPADPVAISEVGNVVGSVMERKTPQCHPPVGRLSIDMAIASAKVCPPLPTSPPPPDLDTTVPASAPPPSSSTRPKSKFRAARQASM
eukprot:scpid81964/ scgid6367/ Unconventional prefoldin RPB5 interactor; Protein NNX3; Protein phosphatase 1 regulatory subunit 19; RNA polymerase II subunit 5-mediating protein